MSYFAEEVPPWGDVNSKVGIIGEAPGAVEMRVREPFRGPAGTVLEQCLHGAGLIRSECYIDNIFPMKVKKIDQGKKILTQDNDLLWRSDKGFTQHGEVYVNELKERLEKTTCNVLVPMGNVALDALISKRGIYKWRGSILESTLIHRKCVPTIHPAASLQGGDYLVRYYIVFDLKRVKEEMNEADLTLPHQNFLIQQDFLPTIEWLDLLYIVGKRNQPINYDVEIINHEISCLSFTTRHSWAISIPLTGWTVDEEIRIWLAIAKIMEDPDITKVNQNITFDAWMLLHKNKILNLGRKDDPMIAHSIIYPDFPKDLGFITSVYTRVPYYKDEGKIWFKGMGKDIRQFYNYNCQDSAVSIEAMRKLQTEIDEKNFRSLYEETIQLLDPLLYMMTRGVKIDLEKFAKVKAELEQKEKDKQEELDTLLGFSMNVKSTKQKIAHFYGTLGIKPYLKNGSPTTDSKAMARLAKGTATRKPIPEARLVQEVTKVRDALSKYMEIGFDKDGRMRCSYNPRGTTTGRLSSSETLLGTGHNMQNLTEDFKKFIVADPGYIFFEIDKVQAEWAVVAYTSGDNRMIEILESGLDAHVRTGHLITRLPEKLIEKEADLLSHETNPDTIQMVREQELPEILQYESEGFYIPRHMTTRQMGKKSNHGGNYGIGYRRCALEWEIPEAEAKKILPLYHKAYPGVEQSYQRGIRQEITSTGCVTNCFGRVRKFYRPSDGKVNEQGYSFKAQSTVADILNKGMIKIYQDTSENMHLVEILAQIHDSLLMQYPVSVSLVDFAQAIQTCFEYLNPLMNYFGREFRIKSDLKIGTCWGDMRKVEVIHGETTERLARRLSEVYRGL